MIASIRTRRCFQSYICCGIVHQLAYPTHELKLHIYNIYKTVCFCGNTQADCFYYIPRLFKFF
ncbi:TPA: hypothetical protein ACMU2U_002415 [Clostridioides difficile]|uniref:hypothetical protein n=1 Tax=Clostridioides difficile TaxID=1496 RepID=UPI001034940D|nr:hypothetical protein [Clostridioides difficile]EGT5445741.1 hypothetical protein [Clostridioides difficile]MBY2559344.1 hypothetical protein [Clostridioides difficile]MBZ1302370.1 hypothetical protein [Clostridioides difficile]MCW0766996.1 hypothetical protein [Clostridioides difficile]HBE8459540.1 hypothetical protein [Clostridioides difficile]